LTSELSKIEEYIKTKKDLESIIIKDMDKEQKEEKIKNYKQEMEIYEIY